MTVRLSLSTLMPATPSLPAPPGRPGIGTASTRISTASSVHERDMGGSFSNSNFVASRERERPEALRSLTLPARLLVRGALLRADADDDRFLARVLPFEVARGDVQPAAVDDRAAVDHARRLDRRVGGQVELPLLLARLDVDGVDDAAQVAHVDQPAGHRRRGEHR